jgi:signal transduction histidine kinase
MRRSSVALLLAGTAIGLAVELVYYDAQLGPALTVADFLVGFVLLAAGALARDRRPESRVGMLALLSGGTWFAGNVGPPLLYLHRGPLVHLCLSYPTGRLRSRVTRAVVAFAWVDGAIEPLARNTALTFVLSGAVAVAAIRSFLATSGPARKAAEPALGAALAIGAALSLGAVGRIADWNADAVLLAYDVVVAAVAIVLVSDLVRRRWADAVVTGLVVDLGARGGTLRGKLAHALGDPSLVIGYRLTDANGFVDEAGRPVELPRPGSGRSVTPLVDRGEEVAVLVHDDALLTDRRLVESVAAAARIAVANVGLQADARARAAELEASRRRIVEAGDAQRRRLERELRAGAEDRLAHVASVLADVRASVAAEETETIAELEAELVRARRELEEFARGIHPAALTAGGISVALAHLAERSPIPVYASGTVDGLPEPIEAALFFVCSEALTNAAKHSGASRVTIDVEADGHQVAVAIADDGVGGATIRRGSGLAGLVDRVEALGGTLLVESPRGGGTRVVASLPRVSGGV